MPRDSKGNFHMNAQRAAAAEKMPVKPKPVAITHSAVRESDGMEGGSHTTLHDHGDGTFHTEGHDGEHTEHPHIGHALMHMAAKHGGGGKHMHVHSDGMGTHTTHHTGEDGQVEGPHDHENMEALKQHMDQFLGEEENEGSDWGRDEY